MAGYRRHRAPALHDIVGVLQLVFATVAGAGALVALIVAYRRQKITEADSAHDRTRVFNERFTTIAAQLGDAQPAVRLAGVHAMAGLADDWQQNRQTCVDVLCAFLRLPYDPDPGEDADPAERIAYRANREVRHTIIRLIGAHLRLGPVASWQGLDFDFTDVVFDGGDFTGARFSGGTVLFTGARFSGGKVIFDRAEFASGEVYFTGASFSGGAVSFDGAKFSGGTVDFDRAEFSGGSVSFGAWAIFGGAEFSGGTVSFSGAKFSSGTVYFPFAKFSGSTVDFSGAGFSGGTVSFSGAGFSGGTVSFGNAWFSGGQVSFGGTRFPTACSASAALDSPAARSTSATPGSLAVRSASATPGSPVVRSASAAPSSPAGRSASSTLCIGHTRRRFHGMADRQLEYRYRLRRPRNRANHLGRNATLSVLATVLCRRRARPCSATTKARRN